MNPVRCCWDGFFDLASVTSQVQASSDQALPARFIHVLVLLTTVGSGFCLPGAGTGSGPKVCTVPLYCAEGYGIDAVWTVAP